MKYVIGFLAALLMMGAVSIYHNRLSTPEDYIIASIQEASKRLDTFVKHEQLDRADFSGPYVLKTDNVDPPTYTTYYKSDEYHFYYSQGGDMANGYKVSEIECTSSECQWLLAQPRTSAVVY